MAAKVIADARIATEPPADAKIWGDLKLLRAAIGGLQAKQAKEVPFPVKSAKELMTKFRKAMDRYQMSCRPVYAEQHALKREKGSAVSVAMIWRITSSDGSFLDIAVPSFGTDAQDKATGKAITYGWKFAIMYLLSLPDADIKSVWEEPTDISKDTDSVHGPTAQDVVSAILATRDVTEFNDCAKFWRGQYDFKKLNTTDIELIKQHRETLNATVQPT